MSDEKLGFMIDRCRSQGPEVALPLLLEEMRRRDSARLRASSEIPRPAPAESPASAGTPEFPGSPSHFWTFHYQDYVEPEEGFDERGATSWEERGSASPPTPPPIPGPPSPTDFSFPWPAVAGTRPEWLRESPVRWEDTDEMPPQGSPASPPASLPEASSATSPAAETPNTFESGETNEGPETPESIEALETSGTAVTAPVPEVGPEVAPDVGALPASRKDAGALTENEALVLRWAMLLAFLLALVFILSWAWSRRRD